MSFPCQLSTLTNLASLDLSFNKIQSAPCNLASLSNLTSINLSNNNMCSFPSELLALPYLTAFDISSNPLHSMPCEISGLMFLSILDLSHTWIKSVQCDLSNLTKLTTLNLARNQLSTFPCRLSALTQLTSLQLSSNRIASVLCDLSNLTKLTTLDLHQNALQTVPSDLFSLRQLTYLDLSHNKIESGPCGLSTLTQLTHLDLSSNYISNPCDLSNLTNLITFDLRKNMIQVLDSWPISLAQTGGRLNNIFFQENNISKFTNHAGGPAKLCNTITNVISLQYNNITHFMDIAQGWDFKTSSQEELYDCLDFLLPQNLGNPLACDCIDYEVYKLIQRENVSHHHFKCHYPPRLSNKDPTELPLDQFICEISHDCPLNCNCINNPYHQSVIIKCEHMEGTSLPTTVPKLPSEEYWYDIDFCFGNLSKVSYKTYLKYIMTVKFSHNHISELTMDALLALQNVSILHLDFNSLKRLPDNLTTIRFKNATDIKLSHNPWVCDCTALGAKKWMEDHADVISDVHAITCHSPKYMVNKNMLYTEDYLFCPNDNRKYTIIGIVFGVCFFLICMFSVITVRIQQWIIARRLARKMVILDDMDVDKEFDVFVSYASEDEDYILDRFIPELENHNIKVCLHRIHFLGGNTIIDNISECINHSKRTLVYFTNFYKDSRFCMYEFKEALNKDVREGTIRLITIKDTDLDMADLDDSTRAYFEKRTYIDKDAVKFWDNLLYTLPKGRDNAQNI